MVDAARPAVSRAGKSQAAFRTISEVADELEVAQHVLRFWESKFTQVRPLKRGGGRRYYRPEDVELLREIRALLYDQGYTIKGAQKLLRQRRARTAGVRPAAEEAQPRLAVSEPAQLAKASPAAVSSDDERRTRLLNLRDSLMTLRADLDEALHHG